MAYKSLIVRPAGCPMPVAGGFPEMGHIYIHKCCLLKYARTIVRSSFFGCRTFLSNFQAFGTFVVVIPPACHPLFAPQFIVTHIHIHNWLFIRVSALICHANSISVPLGAQRKTAAPKIMQQLIRKSAAPRSGPLPLHTLLFNR